MSDAADAIPALSSQVRGLEIAALALLRRALDKHHPAIALAASFSIEDVTVADLLSRIRPDFRVFAIDTGRLPEATLLCADAVAARFGIGIEWYFPRHEAVEKLIRAKGTHSFCASLDNRHECCGIRKIEPLSRALAGLSAWITGLRREQSVSRAALEEEETDTMHNGMAKYNPLAAWSSGDVMSYATVRRLPFNRLYAEGYRSIGCAPCTRAVQAGEDERAGRWWWEDPEQHKECGLHVQNGVVH